MKPTDVEGDPFEEIRDEALAKLMLAVDDFNEAFKHYRHEVTGLHWTDRAGLWIERPPGKVPQIILTRWTGGVPEKIYPE